MHQGSRNARILDLNSVQYLVFKPKRRVALTLFVASINLTPLYETERIIVGTFFICSVDF
jgi:hypothetical protein